MLVEGAMLTKQEHGQLKRAGPRNSTTFLRSRIRVEKLHY